jgi:hypothetical protein
LNVGTKYYEIVTSNAQANNYGEIRGGVVVLAFGEIKTNSRNANHGGTCETCLMPGTAGNNLWDTNYTGKNNPLSYNLQENYSLPPTNRADFGSMIHDKGYDRHHAIGPSSVMTDTETIGVDYRFIGYELDLAISPYNGATLQEKGEGLANGLYMFIFTLPKTMAYGLSAIKN